MRKQAIIGKEWWRKMEDWKVLRKISNRRSLGTVWLIESSVENLTGNDIERGYFKFATPKSQKYIGPLAATELIAYRIANLLNLPAAEVKLVSVEDQLGSVSLIKPVQPLYHWRHLSSRILHHIPDYIINPERLLKTFVFDIWICNFDRHGGNMMAYPVSEKYDFYLIDHGLSLAGVLQRANFPWDHPFWERKPSFRGFYLKGTRKYIRSYDQLEPYVKEIQNIPPLTLEEILDTTPQSILPSETKTIMKKFLFHRQQKLPELVKRLF
jgi:hypothetical protein